MCDAQASDSEPQSRYLQIERRCKDLIVYANIMVKQFPKREKYQMAARIMGLCYDLLELAITTGKRLHKKTTLTQMNVKHEVLRQLVNVAYELRYIDDAVMVDEDKGRLREAMESLTDVLQKLRLERNPKSGIRRVRDGVDFVGYRHAPGCRLIRKRSLYNLRRKLARDPSLPKVMAYLSHALDTASLPRVIELVRQAAPEFTTDIRRWEAAHGHA